MTTAGGGTPSIRRSTNGTRHAAPPEIRPSSGVPHQWDVHHGWNATDDQGYRYRNSHPESGQAARGFFAGPLREYVMSLGHSISLLQAGCGVPLAELGIGDLEAAGPHVSSVTAVDTDHPLVRRVLEGTARDAARGAAQDTARDAAQDAAQDTARDAAQDAARGTVPPYADVIIGDLRTVPIPPRAFEIVYCANLLERIEHVELVLDRLVNALKPGGLLLISTHDRQTAYACLDRFLPPSARKALWKRLHPGMPGPFPTIYERAVTERGIASYAQMRGLVIAQRCARHSLPATPRGISSSVRITCAVISGLTRGRFSNTHDELLYVIRKPQDSFAHVI
jgi:SAM-dependent methyltransferase